MHPHGFLIIMQLLEVTDDTVSLQKQILAEITNPEVGGVCVNAKAIDRGS
jgi:hypothetical protein